MVVATKGAAKSNGKAPADPKARIADVKSALEARAANRKFDAIKRYRAYVSKVVGNEPIDQGDVDDAIDAMDTLGLTHDDLSEHVEALRSWRANESFLDGYEAEQKTLNDELNTMGRKIAEAQKTLNDLRSRQRYLSSRVVGNSQTYGQLARMRNSYAILLEDDLAKAVQLHESETAKTMGLVAGEFRELQPR